MSNKETCIYLGQALADYGFKDGHPFGPQRHDAFRDELLRLGLDQQLSVQTPVLAAGEHIELFHTDDYIDKACSKRPAMSQVRLSTPSIES